ncbi:dihydrolipoyl dehydrogenase [Cohaesibacter gelatinilyticus]|uniref:Dihydrolipoyl dehydrogenase n=1 Tax=Cohaesibacter gelatinilyticus TaxID=372072 RepID=A0A285PIH9_9HYPH|nr:dihydrolipoyl dehydrogenase [Cohaesibacter gelatinilyticus]SNZ21532.1 dihydrolipoamide dehydrogenase [Cohaesibacter gelatinilyticus]
MTVKVEIPDIGDFSNVPVIELNVSQGDVVEIDEPLLMLESDKATLEVPAPIAGKVTEILVAEGDLVSKGSAIMMLEAAKPTENEAATQEASLLSQGVEPNIASDPVGTVPSEKMADLPRSDLHADTVVVGAGPGGYSAAFRAADLGQSVILIDNGDTLGGVCLNVGCIPSKALLHIAKVMDEAEEVSAHGVDYGTPSFNLDKVRDWKKSVVSRLTGGLKGLARKRKVTTIQGFGTFGGPNQFVVSTAEGKKTVSFQNAIIAVGSSPVKLPFIPEDPRVIDSTGALELEDIPKRLLVLGGGIIGMELGQVYQRFGSQVSVVEMMPQIIPGADKDVIAPLMKRASSRFKEIMLQTQVTAVEAAADGLIVTFKKGEETRREAYDKILVAVGRAPNGKKIAAETAGVAVDERGFIKVDRQMRTNIPHILAIGDVVGQPMLAHKAVHEAHIAAEVIAGHKAAFDAAVIPSVAYTDPEVAWVGLTENEAKEQGIIVKKAVFPWMASGRSLAMGRDDGLTKLLFDPKTKRILGAGIVGQNAGDLIAEVALAIELGADAEDIALTIHPHPTLSESVGLAAEVFEGTITDL